MRANYPARTASVEESGIATKAFNAFVREVYAIMKDAGMHDNEPVFFDHDKDEGLFTARIPSEEICITRRESGTGMSVKLHGRMLV